MIKTKFRLIKNKIPSKKTLNLINNLKKVETLGMHGQLPVVWDKAKDFQVYDHLGNKFIDFSSTILVANIGHGNNKLISGINKIIKKPLIHTYNYVSQERYDYIKLLIKETPKQFQKAFLMSSGTESTEAALKIMRLNSLKFKKGKNVIITFSGNWHGRTLGAEMMGNKPELKNWITYHDPNIICMQFPYPWIEDVKKDPKKFFKNNIKLILKKYKLKADKDIAGFIIEGFQGWGTVFYPENFMKELNIFCKKNKILITIDEIQSGFGRTGKLFSYMHYQLKPDLVCCGKGASSGLPLSIILGSKKLMDLPPIGSMSSTHSGNPLACVAGKVTLEELKRKKLISRSQRIGKKLHIRLNTLKNKYPRFIKYVFGKGLVASVIFYTQKGKKFNEFTNQLAFNCLKNGLILINTGKETLKIAPPLTINEFALYEGIDIIDQQIKKLI